MSRILITGFFLTWLSSLECARGCGVEDYTPPPTLDCYRHTLPGKSIAEILGSAPASTSQNPGANIDKKELENAFASPDPKVRVATVDKQLAAARAGGSPDTDLNMLEAIRDASAMDVKDLSELLAFLEWRVDKDAWFAPDNLNLDHVGDVETKLTAASPELKPCFLYALGALEFRGGDMDKSEGYFDQILTTYPNSPVAETALYMKARCLRSQPDKADKSGETAQHCFQQYIAQYPNGRFVADAWGWLGGLESDSVQALVDFLNQAKNTDHPEERTSAENGIDQILNDLDAIEGDRGYDELAQHPDLALAFTYQILGTYTTPPRADNDSTPSAEDQAKLEKWRATGLPKLAAAVLAHRDLYSGADEQDRYLTILAHAASDVGEQKKALSLLAISKNQQPGDDFLYIKAVALQRSGRFQEAAQMYRQILAMVPKSSMDSEAQYRLGLALHYAKKDGDALLELTKLTNNQVPSPPDTECLACSQDIVDQTIDTILNFAPLDSLAPLLKQTDSEHAVLRQQLREIVVARYLEKEDFAAAAQYTDDSNLKKQFSDKKAQADLLLNPASPKKIPQATLAKSALDLADYWKSNRFNLTWLPLQANMDLHPQMSELSDEQRRLSNGLFLNYARDEICRELDSRDELSHAIPWWKRSMDFEPRDENAPTALWAMMYARLEIDERSPYTEERAIEMNHAQLVHQQYARLINTFPHSDEAREYAAYWTLPKPQELDKNYSGEELLQRFPGYYSEHGNFHHPGWFSFLNVPYEDALYPYGTDDDKLWQAVLTEIKDLANSSAHDSPTQFSDRIKSLMAKAHPLARDNTQAAEINFLDDLLDLAQVPNLDPIIRTDYVKTRIDVLGNENVWTQECRWRSVEDRDITQLKDLTKDPHPAELADFFACLDMRDLAGDSHLTTDDFVRQFPKSIKLETIAYYHIRFTLHALSAVLDNKSVPDAKLNSTLDSAFSDYQKEYADQGKFARGVLWMQGETDALRNKWGSAANTFALLLKQDQSPELKQDAAYQLALIFDSINEASLRKDVLTDVMRYPLARSFLKDYVNCGQIPFLKDYVLERLGNER